MTLDEDGAASPGFRRTSPVRQVLTIFGDYWWHVAEPMPTGAIVTALTDLGLKEAAARATLTRMVRGDLLRADRVGRRTTHRLTPRAREVVDEEGAWLDAFGLVEVPWDGLWSVLAFSIPEAERSSRHLARARLRWLGFAPLYDGVWLSPRDRAGEAMAQLQELGVRDVTSMRATLETSIAGGPQSAWDLDDVAAEYRRFAASVGGEVELGDPVAAFRERMRIMLGWQAFRVRDTGMPAELVPADWPRVSTRRAWARRYNALGECAEQRMRGLVAEIDAGLAELVSRRRMREESNT
ncbi:PaaX family transcriptional regulator C-terminal domain-containing protein [Microbacterium sp. BK668]|uniref:PaaX family transcriptional regulator n=1 Tax=Microbacterium sp. BK668 TaxID=2512118 RepID=UPI00105C4665|nr:PaaX family transcriptional regulator C-terminal domain-containing protein [Microbacterium sp. BK668]TDN91224.1 PaaX family transcriptional regulator [Microbacterium sp. BK668]